MSECLICEFVSYFSIYSLIHSFANSLIKKDYSYRSASTGSNLDAFFAG